MNFPKEPDENLNEDGVDFETVDTDAGPSAESQSTRQGQLVIIVPVVTVNYSLSFSLSFSLSLPSV